MNFEHPNDVVRALRGITLIGNRPTISLPDLLERWQVWGHASADDVACARNTLGNARMFRVRGLVALASLIPAAFLAKEIGVLSDGLAGLAATISFFALFALAMLLAETDLRGTLDPIVAKQAQAVSKSLAQSSMARDYRDLVVKQTERELLQVDGNIIVALARIQHETDMLEALKTVGGSGAPA